MFLAPEDGGVPLIARTTLATLAAAAAAAALPAAAHARATATQTCTVIEAREPGSGPPPRAALITVIDANGRLRTAHFVPGPCTAPGFAKQAPGA
jgi:hypothetical protein